jgi:NADH:ubiquinone oxidoreductase subunit 5 (subunit L)/multisubunit Na+/H+ antiporter MnhA subunit
VYFVYYRKSKLMKIAAKHLAPMSTVLEHGYFFDDFYEKVVAGGIMKVTKGLGYIEDTILTRLPYFVADGVTNLARGTHKYFDVLVDRMLYVAANRTLAYSSKIGKRRNESLQRYIVASLLGFLIILIIVIVTILR